MMKSAVSRWAAVLGAAALTAAGLMSNVAQAEPTTGTQARTAQPVRLAPGQASMGWSQRANQAGVAQRSTAPTITGVLGMDVSSWQGYVDWAKYRSYGRVFAYAKATEGSKYRNPYFPSQFTGAGKAGMYRGAYHFAIPSGASGTSQANYFVDNGGGWKTKNMRLPGVLDIEYNPYGSTCYGLSKTKMTNWIGAFLAQYKKRTGRDAVIYTTTDWWTRCTGNTTKFSKTNPLWVARYGTTTPGTLPGGWTFYTFWQYSATPIDQNKFSSSMERLALLANGTLP